MSEEFADIGQAPVIACQRNFSSTNGHVDHLAETSDAGMNGHTDLEQDNGWIQVDGFPKSFSNGSFQSNHDTASSSGIKRHKNNHHDHLKHHHKQSHHRHHRRTSNGNYKKAEQKRFCRTASALKQAGLLELTLQTAQLIQENETLQKEIDSLQQQTLEFSKSLQEQLEEKVKSAKANGYS